MVKDNTVPVERHSPLRQSVIPSIKGASHCPEAVSPTWGETASRMIWNSLSFVAKDLFLFCYHPTMF